MFNQANNAARTMSIEAAAGLDGLSIIPANESSCEDLDLIFGARGMGRVCQCQRYKLEPGESFGSFPIEERVFRLRQQTDCGGGDSDATSGLVAYFDRVPVGWCAVESRALLTGLLRSFRVPWDGRDEDRTDSDIWALTCFFTRAGFRKRGVSKALASAAVGFARDRGASALEGYPIVTKNVIAEELHVGTLETFLQAGFDVVSHPTSRRVVVRIGF